MFRSHLFDFWSRQWLKKCLKIIKSRILVKCPKTTFFFMFRSHLFDFRSRQWLKKCLRMIKSRNLIKKKPKWFKNKKTEFDTINARASEASGPTRIRFCAKYQKNQHYYPETPKKKPDSDLKYLKRFQRPKSTVSLMIRCRLFISLILSVFLSFLHRCFRCFREFFDVFSVFQIFMNFLITL